MTEPTASGEGQPGEVTRIAEEFLRLREAGELTDLDAFCAQHPEGQRAAVREECENLLRIRGVIKQPDRLSPGQRLGSYEIVEQIGAGGMGEVYRARDPNLDRDIAIKVLPPELACQPERVKRFKREAKAIAAMDHPNIVTIHSVEESDGLHFITMQLVQGKTLSELIPKKGFALDRFFDLAIPLADAISNAHEQGITHRDLKPANVMVTADGRVEILDFGLAKLRPQVTAELTTQMTVSSLTDEGQIVGTVAYMSPEQAEGRAVDHRSDIFSLGIILYEMATGQRPFKGDTPLALMSSIMKDTPTSVLELSPQLPNHLGRIIRRSLEKDLERRFQTGKDLRNELQNLRWEVSSGEVEVTAADGIPPRRRVLRTLGICSVTALAAVLATVALTGERGQRNPLDGVDPVYITQTQWTEFDAAISHDGKYVAYVSDQDGVYDVWARQIGDPNPVNKTNGGVPVWIQNLRQVGFEAAGRIWVGGGTGRRMQSTSLLSDEWSHTMGNEVVNIDWQQDGSLVVYHTREEGDPLYVTEPNVSPGLPILRAHPGIHQHHPVWSFDERHIYFVRGRPRTGDMDLHRIQPDGTGLKQLTSGMKDVAYPTPIDEGTVLFVAKDSDGSGPWLWILDTSSDAPPLLAFDRLLQYRSVSASKNGRRLVATVANPQSALWTVPIPVSGEIATESDVTEVQGLPALRAQAPRTGQGSTFFLASSGTGDELWSLRDGAASRVSSFEHSLPWPPSIEPDGARVALASLVGSRWILHLISTEDGTKKPLTDRIDVRGTSSWSPDGEFIVVGGSDGTSDGLFKIRVSDGSVERIADGRVMNPVWSPRDDLIVYAGEQVEAVSPLVAITPDRKPVEIPVIHVPRGGERFRFLRDGTGLVYLQGLRPAPDFMLLDLTSKKSRQLTDLEGVEIRRTFDVTPEGTIVFDRIRLNSDIILIDLESRSNAAGRD